LEFPIVYAIGKAGLAKLKMEDEMTTLEPLFQTIIDHIPPPKGDSEEPLQMLVANLDYSDYLGRLAIGRMFNGTLKTGTDVAMHAAGITLMRGDLFLVPAALDIARRTRAKIRQGLFWAFVYNIVGIPLAALGLLTPTLAGAAMAGFLGLSAMGSAGSAQQMCPAPSSADGSGLRPQTTLTALLTSITGAGQVAGPSVAR
jgi:hypothetical protein